LHIITDGLVIKEQNVGESDRLITVLTSKYGVIRAFATGAKSIKNKNLAGTQLLAYSDFVFYKGKDAYNVNSAIEKEVFFGLRSDIDNLSTAFYLADLVGEFAPETADSEELLKLLLNSIYLLSKKKKTAPFIKSLVELRALSIAGYMPDLVACSKCGEFEAETVYFNIKSGTFCCAGCGHPDLSQYPISISTLTAMRHIIYSDAKKIYDFELTPDAEKELATVAEAFALEHTGRHFKTLDFLKSLSIPSI